MNRRAFLASLAAPAIAQPRPRNILLLIADDLGLHTGAYGDPAARTPHLDRLASEGVRFTHAFCTTASCSASRSVLHSGLYNHANGQFGHAHDFHHFSYHDFVRPVSSLLKDAGYWTGVVGKMHVSPGARFRWDLDSEANDRDVRSLAARARGFILSAGSNPWFLQVGYGDPHRSGAGTDFSNKPYPGVTPVRFDPARVSVPSFLPDNAATRGELAEYYQAANRLDQGIGMMIEVLRDTRQWENTLVVFLSDNGMPFPNAKTNLYEGGVRLPLIVRSPSQSRRGLVNTAMVNWADLAPTFLEWAGAKAHSYPLHGRSFLSVLERESPAGWDQVFFSHTFHEITMYYPMRGVRTRRYKYIRNLFPELEFPFATDLFASATWQSVRRGGMLGKRKAADYLKRAPEELYDLSSDPDEVRNLAGEAAHRDTLIRLRAATEKFRRDTNDPWLINDRYK